MRPMFRASLIAAALSALAPFALAKTVVAGPGGQVPPHPLIVGHSTISSPGRYGGTLYEVLGGAPATFNIYGTLNPHTYTVMMHNVLSPLIRENPVTGALEPGLATSWSSSKGGLKYTIHLRRGVRWSDGAPFSAQDVIFTMRCAEENPAAQGNNAGAFTIGGKTVAFSSPNPYTVVAKLVKPDGSFLRLLNEVDVIPKHVLAADCPFYNPKATNAQFNAAWSINTPPKDIVGTGPFELAKYVPGQEVVLRRNPYSFYASTYGQQLPYANHLTYLIVKSPQVQVAMFESKQLSLLGLNASQFSTLKAKQVAGAPFQVLLAKNPYPSALAMYFNYNDKHPDLASLFSKARFRRAVGEAIDYHRIIDQVFHTLAAKPVGWISPASVDYSAKYRGDYGKYDPAAAKKLLASLGLHPGSSGILHFPDGKPVQFTLITYGHNSSDQKMGEVVQADLAKVGIKVNLKLLNFSLLIQQSFGGNFDASLFGFGSTPNNQFRQPIWQPGGSLYFWHLSDRVNKKADPSVMFPWERALYKDFVALDTTTAPAARSALWDKIQRIYAQEQPATFLVWPDAALSAVQSNVGNVFIRGGYLWAANYALYLK